MFLVIMSKNIKSNYSKFAEFRNFILLNNFKLKKMSAKPVLIEDDDDMEPVVIDDGDDEKVNSENTNGLSTVETIDLDDESPTNSGKEKVNDNEIIINGKKKRNLKKFEAVFVNHLKNNKLMNKIVSTCLNMENALGMPRVINKTVIPLYRDTDNRFKASEEFRSLLKKTYKMLVRDPDHKFLHVKTLCEELKSGGLRRKVPFVTLATNLKSYDGSWGRTALSSSSRPINYNKQQEQNSDRTKSNNHKDSTENNNKRKYYSTNSTTVRKKPKKSKPRKTITTGGRQSRSCTYYSGTKNYVISLDNSDNESVINLDNEEASNNIVIIDEAISSGTDKSHSDKGTQENYSTKENTALENINKEDNEVEHINKVNNEVKNQKSNFIYNESCSSNTQADKNYKPDSNKVLQEENDSNKENSELGNSAEYNLDFEHLIPLNHLELVTKEIIVEPPRMENNEILAIENQISCYKTLINELEEAEVTDDSEFSSPYIECARYKKTIVQLYQKLCKLNDNCEEIVKRQEIRLHVAEGHPSGPAKRLEYFLNEKIDSTGTVAFPDFSDVVKCVIHSNFVDRLGWDRKQVFQEAVALFRQCGQALRKRRQKREFKDLLSLVHNKEQTDDPAENDPLLLAKLEQNKQIARIKEEQLLERYVNMEHNISSGVDSSRVGHVVEFEIDENSSDSDNETELNVHLKKNFPSVTINDNYENEIEKKTRNNISSKRDEPSLLKVMAQNFNNDFRTREISNSNDILNNSVAVPANKIPLASTVINNISQTGISSISNIKIAPKSNTDFKTIVTNNLQTGESSKNNLYLVVGCVNGPTISNIVTTSSINSIGIGNSINNNISEPLTFDKTIAIIDNHCQIGESSVSNDITSNSYLTSNNIYVPTATISQDCEINSHSNNKDNENGNSENVPVINTYCNTLNYQNNISSPPNEAIVQNDVSTIAPEGDEVKLEDIIKSEPLDIQNMLDELGDNFECKILDIEDPFLVIEISSDGYSDDD